MGKIPQNSDTIWIFLGLKIGKNKNIIQSDIAHHKNQDSFCRTNYQNMIVLVYIIWYWCNQTDLTNYAGAKKQKRNHKKTHKTKGNPLIRNSHMNVAAPL